MKTAETERVQKSEELEADWSKTDGIRVQGRFACTDCVFCLHFIQSELQGQIPSS